jgi:hypothetical protein
MIRAVPVGAPCTHHGEGPFWDEPTASPPLVDMLAGDVLRIDDAGAPARSHVGTVAAAGSTCSASTRRPARSTSAARSPWSRRARASPTARAYAG